MRVILEGNERDVQNIIQENRIRVARGKVKFLPSNEEVSDDKVSGVVDSKAAAIVDEKKPKRSKSNK